MDRVGTCTSCGGAMIVPHGMVHNTAYCQECGSIKQYEEPKEFDSDRDPGDETDDDSWAV